MGMPARPRETIAVEGVFDLAVASIIRAKLIDVVCRTVVIDFHGAREVGDAALAHLAATLARWQGPHIVLRGLSQHQERMLRYLHAERSGGDA